MCNATAALAAQAGGGAMDTVGAFYTAKSQKSALNASAEADMINARLAELQAQSALTQGAREEQRSKLQTGQLKSAQKTGFAANGVAINEGSAANVLTSTDMMGEIDANTIASNAIANAWGYRMEATNFENQARGKRAGAKAINPLMQAGVSLLNNTAKVASSWYQYKDAGAFKETQAEQKNRIDAKYAGFKYGAQSERGMTLRSPSGRFVGGV
jgi:hypothetical protein